MSQSFCSKTTNGIVLNDYRKVSRLQGTDSCHGHQPLITTGVERVDGDLTELAVELDTGDISSLECFLELGKRDDLDVHAAADQALDLRQLFQILSCVVDSPDVSSLVLRVDGSLGSGDSGQVALLCANLAFQLSSLELSFFLHHVHPPTHYGLQCGLFLLRKQGLMYRSTIH